MNKQIKENQWDTIKKEIIKMWRNDSEKEFEIINTNSPTSMYFKNKKYHTKTMKLLKK